MHLIRIYIVITIIKYIRRFFCTAIKGMFSMVYRKYSTLLRTWAKRIRQVAEPVVPS